MQLLLWGIPPFFSGGVQFGFNIVGASMLRPY